MPRGYGQYCAVAKGAEIFAERWTPLVVRNVALECHTFGEILEGVPRMSRTLLAQRLRSLERDGILQRRPSINRRGALYYLTPAGLELFENVVIALGTWGARWLDSGPADYDPVVVLWGWRKVVNQDRLPERRVVVRFDIRDHPHRYWLVLERTGSEVCVRDPGYEEDLVVTTTCEWLAKVHMGKIGFAEAQRRGVFEIEGRRDLVRAFPTWGGLSYFAGVQRAGHRSGAVAS